MIMNSSMATRKKKRKENESTAIIKGNSSPSKKMSIICHYSFSLRYQKQTLVVIIPLHSFVIISFIKTIARITQIHQPIRYDYFEHQPITDKWAERVASACVRARTIKAIFVAEKLFGNEVFSGERFTRGYLHELQDGYLRFKTPRWRWITRWIRHFTP